MLRGSGRDDLEGTVPMIHFLCDVCGMSATMVVTATGDMAWRDHMATHLEPNKFSSWTWSAVPLFTADD